MARSTKKTDTAIIKFNKSQLERLQPYFNHFFTMREGGYSRPVDRAGRKTMTDIWMELTGKERVMNESCSRCVGELVADLGRIFYETMGLTWQK